MLLAPPRCFHGFHPSRQNTAEGRSVGEGCARRRGLQVQRAGVFVCKQVWSGLSRRARWARQAGASPLVSGTIYIVCRNKVDWLPPPPPTTKKKEEEEGCCFEKGSSADTRERGSIRELLLDLFDIKLQHVWSVLANASDMAGTFCWFGPFFFLLFFTHSVFARWPLPGLRKQWPSRRTE